MRDETQGQDVYAWAWPARLSGDNPYEWRGPSQRQAPLPSAAPASPSPMVFATVAEASAPPVPAAEIEPLAFDAPALTDSFGEGPLEDAWVELPPVEEKPARSRRRRSGGRGGRGAAEALEAAEVATASLADAGDDDLDEPAPLALAPSEEAFEPAPAAAEHPVEAASAPPQAPALDHEVLVLERAAPQLVDAAGAEPEPRAEPAAPVFDPAEIVAPAATPRRGWWRRVT
jgi:hypothetical protein